jgi:xanthine/uracil/vitamin C permease (AzgA family)
MLVITLSASVSHRYQYFLKGGQVPNVGMSGGKLNFPGLSKSDTWVALITFLYLDFMDATSVMVGQQLRQGKGGEGH